MREDETFLCAVYCICLELFFCHVKGKPSEPMATQGRMQFYRSVNHLSVFMYVQYSMAAHHIYVTKTSLSLVWNACNVPWIYKHANQLYDTSLIPSWHAETAAVCPGFCSQCCPCTSLLTSEAVCTVVTVVANVVCSLAQTLVLAK